MSFIFSIVYDSGHIHYSVVDDLRLANGILFPIPVTLDVSREDVDRLSIKPGLRIALRDPRDDEALAIITGSY
jgi:sulfate adenylyltransferase